MAVSCDRQGMIKEQLVRSFTHAALSPDPDLAIAALMIARVEYPRLDAGPYLDQLDALGREARLRVESAPTPSDAPFDVDPDRYARVMALNDYLFDELRFVGNERPLRGSAQQLPERGARSADRHSDHARAALHGSRPARRPARRRGQLSRALPASLPRPARPAARRGSDHRRVPRRRAALRGRLPRSAPASTPATKRRSSRTCWRTPRKPQILSRMLLNLKRLYVRMHSFPQARDITELLLAVDPSALTELRDRGLLAYHLNDFSGALRDLQTYLQLSASASARRRRARGARADLGARQDAAQARRVAELANLQSQSQSSIRNHQCPDSLWARVSERADLAVRVGLGAGRRAVVRQVEKRAPVRRPPSPATLAPGARAPSGRSS